MTPFIHALMGSTSLTQISSSATPMTVAIMMAGGNSVPIATTFNGTSWDTQPAPSVFVSNAMRGLIYAGSFWCAVGGIDGTFATKYCYTSTDGQTWTSRTLPANGAWGAMCWNGTTLVALTGKAGTSSSTVGAYTTDGVTWTQSTLPSGYWQSVAWNGSVFCAVAGYNAASSVCATSPDGITWTSRSMPSSQSWTSIAWNGSVFCAVAGGGQSYITTGASVCATSPDGITWTSRNMPSTNTWNSVAWNGSVFCAVTNFQTNDGSTVNTAAATSPDGTTWTARTLSSGGNGSFIVWDSAAGLFIEGYSSGNVCTSPDGTTWTTRATGQNYQFAPRIAAVGSLIPTITVSTPSTTITSSTLTLSGTYIYGGPASSYSVSWNGGSSWTSMTTVTNTGGNWSATVTAPSSAGTYTATVRRNDCYAQASSGSFSVSSPYITVTTPTGKNVRQSYTLAGTWGGSATPTGVQYSYDGGTTWTALTSFSQTTTTWTGTAVAPTAGGSATVMVRKTNETSITGTSGSFAVTAPSITVTTPTAAAAGAVQTISGTITSGATISSMTYSIDGGTTYTALSPTVSGTTWSIIIAAPASGAHTITVVGSLVYNGGGYTSTVTSSSFTNTTGSGTDYLFIQSVNGTSIQDSTTMPIVGVYSGATPSNVSFNLNGGAYVNASGFTTNGQGVFTANNNNTASTATVPVIGKGVGSNVATSNTLTIAFFSGGDN